MHPNKKIFPNPLMNFHSATNPLLLQRFPQPLTLSVQLQEKFGWDAFKKVFAAYHKMTTFPKDNEGKMNLYAETFSQAVGMNLSAFFKAWGWPIQTATEEKLSMLPPWSDHPMVQYD